MSELRVRMESQLPRRETASFATVFNYIAGVASIFGLAAAPYVVKSESAVTITYALCLTGIIGSLIVFSWFRERRKLHRYAQAVYFIHFANHCVRDFMAEAAISSEYLGALDRRLSTIVNAISTCYSILCGKRCRVSLLELLEDNTLKIREVDDIARASKPSFIAIHPLADNTEFKEVFKGENGNTRFYFCNDVLKAWKRQEYESTFFAEYGSPKIGGLLDVVTNWKLPYRSVLVLPIRYVQSPQSAAGESPRRSQSLNYWGFLRIDCNSRNAFDSRLSPELGGAFADALFTLTFVTELLLDHATEG